MKRLSALLIGCSAVLFAACDGSQARLIESYKAAEFQGSNSALDRSEVTLSTSFEIGRAYEVTSRRLEYAAVEPDAEPPIDEWGQLVRPKFMNVVDPTLIDENGEEIVERRSNGVLEAVLPAGVLRPGALYYRWVLEYSSGGDRLTMRKSDIFLSGVDRETPEAEDAPVAF